MKKMKTERPSNGVRSSTKGRRDTEIVRVYKVGRAKDMPVKPRVQLYWNRHSEHSVMVCEASTRCIEISEQVLALNQFRQ